MQTITINKKEHEFKEKKEVNMKGLKGGMGREKCNYVIISKFKKNEKWLHKVGQEEETDIDGVC